MTRTRSASGCLLAIAALSACAVDDPQPSLELSDTAALDASDVEDDVLVPAGYTRADMVEVLPGTWAPADQAERVRATRLADLEALDLRSAGGPSEADAPPSTCDTDYYCTMSGSRTTSWSEPNCSGRSDDHCSATLSASATYHEGFVSTPHCSDPCDSACWEVLESTSTLTGSLTASTDLSYSKMVMLSVDAEATWGDLYVHPTGYTYPPTSKKTSISKSATATGDYFDVYGDTSADFVADSSGYELEYIFNRTTTEGGGRTARKNFSAISMSETCWFE